MKIVAQAMQTDRIEDFAMGALGWIGVGMSRRAAQKVYEQTGIGPNDVHVIELHDCFSTNELVTYESPRPLQGRRGRAPDRRRTR